MKDKTSIMMKIRTNQQGWKRAQIIKENVSIGDTLTLGEIEYTVTKK